MVLWIESHPAGVIAALVFGFSYLLAFGILIASAIVARWRVAADLKATSPVMLTPLAVIAGLLMAFLGSRVWANLDRAAGSIGEEAGAIRQAVLFAEALPPETQATVRASIGEYLRFVEADDWPAMMAGLTSLREAPPGLSEAIHAALAFTVANSAQQLAQQQTTQALEAALVARSHRILLSKAVISSTQWEVIILLDVLILLTVAMVHLDRRITVAVNLFILSTAMAASLVLLLVHDRPFAAGGFTLEPTAFREISIAQ